MVKINKTLKKELKKTIKENNKVQQELTQNIEKNTIQYEKDLDILPSLKATLDEIKGAQKVWEQVLAGGDDVLDATSDTLKPISEDIEIYKTLRNVLKEKTEQLKELKDTTELKRSKYVKAKKDYKDAKALADKIEKDLTQYLAEQKKKEELKKYEEEKKKTDSVETGIGFDLGFYQSLTAIAAAGFTVSLIKTKRKD